MTNFDWISDFRKNRSPFQRVNDVLPNLFDRYLLIPWSVGIIDGFPFAEYPDNKDTIDNINKQHSIERDFGIFLNDFSEDRYRKVRLKEIADRFQVQYCADTANLVKSTPGIVSLIESTVQAVKELIRSLQNNQILNLYIKDYFRYQAIHEISENKDHVTIAAEEYFSFQQDTSWDSTSYLFPDSKAWCLCTLEDYDHFILGCDNSSYMHLKALTSIESFEVGYHSKLDWVFSEHCI